MTASVAVAMAGPGMIAGRGVSETPSPAKRDFRRAGLERASSIRGNCATSTLVSATSRRPLSAETLTMAPSALTMGRIAARRRRGANRRPAAMVTSRYPRRTPTNVQVRGRVAPPCKGALDAMAAIHPTQTAPNLSLSQSRCHTPGPDSARTSRKNTRRRLPAPLPQPLPGSRSYPLQRLVGGLAKSKSTQGFLLPMWRAPQPWHHGLELAKCSRSSWTLNSQPKA